MKVLVQRVKRAGVEVGGEKVAAIAAGLLVFVGVEKGDARPRYVDGRVLGSCGRERRARR